MEKRSFRQFVEQELGKFPHFFIYAILEWTLIFLLLIDGLLAFFVREFAKFFDLKVPCLFCTRIDRVLANRNPNLYCNDSICEDHKKHVSSLSYCHVHKRLSDIRNMCEGCLLSFAMERDSDCDTYKSLVGILQQDFEYFVDADKHMTFQLRTRKKGEALQAEKNSGQRCSCCGEPLTMKPVHSKAKNAILTSPSPSPSPRPPLVAPRNDESRNLELPHVRYKVLKFVSDNESEFPEHEDVNARNQFKEDPKTTMTLLAEAEDLTEDRTPNFCRGNRFVGIPLTDSAATSPTWARLMKKSPLEKTEFNLESNENTASIDADSESIHQLKRQVRLDHKSLMELCMELDEERSASAIAANNAMAMITRLQAEKAALQMDGLQYQRMMEEQVEYDQEALQEINNLLTERDEEIKALEAELEAFRLKYGCLKEDDFMRCIDETDDEDYQEFASHTCSSYNECEDQPNEGYNIGVHMSNTNYDLDMSLPEMNRNLDIYTEGLALHDKFSGDNQL